MTISLIICLVGLIIFAICSGPTKATAAAIAKDMFWVGLLAYLLSHFKVVGL